MKKLSGTILMLLAVITFTQAQEAFNAFKMRTAKEADVVASTLKSELNLSDSELTQLRDLLRGSAAAQTELLQHQETMNAGEVQNVFIRQTGHIEGNLQEIIGKERFKKYLQSKPDIEKKVLAVNKN